MSEYISTIGLQGLHAFSVRAETDISRGIYHFDIIGLGDKAVTESRSRILSAIKNSGFKSPKTAQQKITVLLSPAGLKKEGSHFDLPIALSYIKACGYISEDTHDIAAVGELSLDGTIKPVKNILLATLTAKKLGFARIIVPFENVSDASLIDGICIFGAKNLAHAIAFCNGKDSYEVAVKSGKVGDFKIADSSKTAGDLKIVTRLETSGIDLIKGQKHAKRALEISLAGRHHLVMYGPPGTGKSLLARSAEKLLPDLNKEEAVMSRIIMESAAETNRAVSSGFGKYNRAIYAAPFSDPHHTSSYSAMIGTAQKAGEISLAHNGVLYLDELPEFDRRTLESLRQPLEDGFIKNHRAGGSQVLPADCILLATMNLCRCGNFGSTKKKCTCSPRDLLNYSKKMSGPLADRIDVWVAMRETEERPHGSIQESTQEPISDQDVKITGHNIKANILKVRNIQAKRVLSIFDAESISSGAAHISGDADLYDAADIYSEVNMPNASDTPNSHEETFSKKEKRVRLIAKLRKELSPGVKKILESAEKNLKLSMRSSDSVLLVSRTIADLEDSLDIKEEHVLEALSYRRKD